MGINDHLQKMQVRQAYRNLWHSDLMGTMTADPSCKCTDFVSFCLVSEDLRIMRLFGAVWFMTLHFDFVLTFAKSPRDIEGGMCCYKPSLKLG